MNEPPTSFPTSLDRFAARSRLVSTAALHDDSSVTTVESMLARAVAKTHSVCDSPKRLEARSKYFAACR